MTRPYLSPTRIYMTVRISYPGYGVDVDGRNVGFVYRAPHDEAPKQWCFQQFQYQVAADGLATSRVKAVDALLRLAHV